MVLTLAGSPMQRGLAYGESARELIQEAAARWDADAEPDPEGALSAVVDRTGFVATASRLTPWVVEEIEGIARASGVDLRRTWALNLLDEGWWVRRRPTGELACTAFGVEPASGQRSLIAQNMDLPRRLDGLQVLLDIRPDDGSPRILAPAYAGIVATNALNAAGLGVCVNTLSTLPTSADGLPVACVIRRLAAEATLSGAEAVLRTVPHASGQNYLVGTPTGVVDLECGAGSVTDRPPTRGRVAHTNHVLGERAPDDGGIVSGSVPRLAAIRAGLDGSGPIDVDAATRLLGDPPVCRDDPGDAAFTFSSMVMELTDRPVLHLADGPPSEHPYHRFELADAP
jgi:hypothetical protein